MRTFADEIRAPWGETYPEVQKDYLIPILLTMLDRIEVLEDALAGVLRCQYPVDRSINPAGFGWDMPRLNEVLAELRAPNQREG